MMTKYVLASDSASDEVIVGDKTLTKNGESVNLTKEEYENVTSDSSVKLEEASGSGSDPEQKPGNQSGKE